MAIQKQEYKVLSSNGIHQLAGVVYLPETEPIGFFHVVHGMTEYIGRYERFMRQMAENGWICFGYDHLGH
jgi:alpha-beta hydrolase superfamily lysophospholipase